MSRRENNLPETLKRLRGSVSQAETARLCGITQQSYNRYEAGRVMPKSAALLKIATHYGLTVEQLLNGGDSPRRYTPALLPPDAAADPGTARRLAAPDFTLTRRERVAQLAVAGYDAAAARGRGAQYETLMQHVAGVAEGRAEYAWHRAELAGIIGRHFPPPDAAEQQAGDKP